MIIDEFTGRMMEGRRYSDGTAPGARGQGARHGPGGEPDARLDHLPELLSPVSEARGHDRHGDDRGGRVRRDLQAGSGRDSDQRRRRAQRRGRRGLPHRRREIRGGGEADRRGARQGSAGAGRHHQYREERADQPPSQAEARPACRAERALPRAGSNDRRAGGCAGRGDNRDQHGRPRHRHQARRQSGDAAQDGAGRHRRSRAARHAGGRDPRRNRRGA